MPRIIFQDDTKTIWQNEDGSTYEEPSLGFDLSGLAGGPADEQSPGDRATEAGPRAEMSPGDPQYAEEALLKRRDALLSTRLPGKAEADLLRRRDALLSTTLTKPASSQEAELLRRRDALLNTTLQAPSGGGSGGAFGTIKRAVGEAAKQAPRAGRYELDSAPDPIELDYDGKPMSPALKAEVARRQQEKAARAKDPYYPVGENDYEGKPLSPALAQAVATHRRTKAEKMMATTASALNPWREKAKPAAAQPKAAQPKADIPYSSDPQVRLYELAEEETTLREQVMQLQSKLDEITARKRRIHESLQRSGPPSGKGDI